MNETTLHECGPGEHLSRNLRALRLEREISIRALARASGIGASAVGVTSRSGTIVAEYAFGVDPSTPHPTTFE